MGLLVVVVKVVTNTNKSMYLANKAKAGSQK